MGKLSSVAGAVAGKAVKGTISGSIRAAGTLGAAGIRASGDAIKGLGYAAKGAFGLAGSTINATGAAIGGISKGIGEAVSSIKGTDEAPSSNVGSFGISGEAGKQNVTKPSVSVAAPSVKQATKISVNESDSTEKILQIAVMYLQSIDSKLRMQNEYEVQKQRQTVLKEREDTIEHERSYPSKEGYLSKIKHSQPVKTGMSILKGLGLIGGGALLSALAPKLQEGVDASLEYFNQLKPRLDSTFNDAEKAFEQLSSTFENVYDQISSLPWDLIGDVASGVGMGLLGRQLLQGGRRAVAAGGAISTIIFAVKKYAGNIIKPNKIKAFVEFLAKKLGPRFAGMGISAMTGIGVIIDALLLAYTVYEIYQLIDEFSASEESVPERNQSAQPNAEKQSALTPSSLPNKSNVPSRAALGLRVSPVDIAAYLSSKGLSEEQIQGILANIEAESAFNPAAIGDKGTSGGLFQHHASRFEAMKQFVGSDWKTNWRKQIDFALTEDEMKKYLKQTYTSGDEAAREFTRVFEKPKDLKERQDERAELAKKYGTAGIIKDNAAEQAKPKGAMEQLQDMFKPLLNIAIPETTQKDINQIAEMNRMGIESSDRIVREQLRQDRERARRYNTNVDRQIDNATRPNAFPTNQFGQIGLLDPNYNISENDIISKYIVHFGVA